MKVLEIDFTTKLVFTSPVIDHYFLLRCVPVSKDGQTVTSRNLEIFPETTVVTSRDIFGNVSYQGRIDIPHTEFSFHSTATIIVDRKNGSRDLCYPLYKYNTPLTKASPEMKEFLYSLFEGTDLLESIKQKRLPPHDFQLVTDILQDGIHKKIKYVSGSTNVKTTAEESFKNGKGVCQDYAHIFCSLCREAGIPARYIAGTSKGEGTTHAWAEYFIPDDFSVTNDGTSMQGRWFGIDCTRNKKVDDTYVILATGRDYLDCKVDGGIFRGAADQTMTVFVKTQEKEVKNESIEKREIPSFNLDEKIKQLKMKNQQQQM